MMHLALNYIILVWFAYLVSEKEAFCPVCGYGLRQIRASYLSTSQVESVGEEEANHSLLSLALYLDPEWGKNSFDFVDPLVPNRSIPCNVALMVELNTTPYLIGTPIHNTVAVLCEHNSSQQSSSYFIDPDDEDNLEILELAVSAFYKAYGDDTGIQFQRCPRALTVTQGDLSKITGFNCYPSSPSRKNILDDVVQRLVDDSSTVAMTTNEEEQYLHSFFQRELGDNYMEYLQNFRDDLDQLNSVEQFFDLPGLDDDISLEQYLERKIQSDASKERDVETALRLVSFQYEGQTYWMTQMIQPMILVAKEGDDEQKYLLTQEEARHIVPRLESIIQEQFDSIPTAKRTL